MARNHRLSGNIETQLSQVLGEAANGDLSLDELVQEVLKITAAKLDYSVVDEDRERRTGAAEVVFAEHNSCERSLTIFAQRTNVCC